MDVYSIVEMSVKIGISVDGFSVIKDGGSCVEGKIEDMTIFVVDCSCSRVVASSLDTSVKNDTMVDDSIAIVDCERGVDDAEVSVVCSAIKVDDVRTTAVVLCGSLEESVSSDVVSMTADEYGNVISSEVTMEGNEATVVCFSENEKC